MCVHPRLLTLCVCVCVCILGFSDFPCRSGVYSSSSASCVFGFSFLSLSLESCVLFVCTRLSISQSITSSLFVSFCFFLCSCDGMEISAFLFFGSYISLFSNVLRCPRATKMFVCLFVFSFLCVSIPVRDMSFGMSVCVCGCRMWLTSCGAVLVYLR